MNTSELVSNGVTIGLVNLATHNLKKVKGVLASTVLAGEG